MKRLFLLLALVFVSSALFSQQIRILFPKTRIVFQRNNSNSATFSIQGTYTGSVTSIEARLIPAFSGQGTATNWTIISNSPSGGSFTGSLTGTGGWYNLEIKTLNGSTIVGQTVVEKVGIGEVFVVAGQSNAEGNANYPGAVRGAIDDRVSAIDYVNYFLDEDFLPFDYVHDGDYMRNAPYNPVPWYWARLGDLIVNRFNVPVCFYGAALGSSPVSWWSRSANGEDLRAEHSLFIKVPGMPYRGLKAALQQYTWKTGVRAVLWHQGESDQSTSDNDYYNRLQNVINKTRSDFESNDLAWVIARVYRHPAQNLLTETMSQVYKGPNTDTIDAPGDRIIGHFQLQGLTKVANAWNYHLDNTFFNNTIPQSPRLIAGNPIKNPIAVINPTQATGDNDFIVNFNSTQSAAINGSLSSYQWAFDEYGGVDYGSSTAQNPTKNFIRNNEPLRFFFTTSLKVRDSNGLTGATSVRVAVNNVAPVINSTSIDNLTHIPSSGTTLNLSAVVTDADNPSSQIYHEWSVTPYLNGLPQPQPAKPVYQKTTSMIIPATNCSAGTQFFRVKLKVIDSLGIAATYEKDLILSCTIDSIAPSTPAFVKATNIAGNTLTLNWGAATDNVAINNYKIYRNGTLIGTVNANTTTFNVTGLSTNTSYKFSIVASDYSNNQSESSPIVVSTNNCVVGTTQYLSDLTWVSATNGFGPVEKDKSNGDGGDGDGTTIKLNGVSYSKGLGVHANSTIIYNLNGNYARFKSDIGLDDEVDIANQGSVGFEVYADNILVYQSPTMTNNTSTISLDIDVTGKNQLKLVVNNGGDNTNYDHADWANARLELPCSSSGDTQAPTQPANLIGSNYSSNSFLLTWDNSSDNVGVTSYDAYVNGVYNSSILPPATFLVINDINFNQNHVISVQARDAAGNVSVGAPFKTFSGTQPCQTNLYISANPDGTIVGSIKYEASQKIFATNSVLNGTNVSYDAAKSVTLNPGFKVEAGAVFRAYIDGCGNN